MKNKISVIGEIANSHQGDFKQAIKLASEINKTGINAIKFQIYSADELLVKKHSRFKHFKNQAFSKKEWEDIFNSISNDKIEIYADVFGLDSLKFAKNLKLDGIKIHSSDLGNIPLLDQLRDFKGKIFFSAGGSTIPELKDSISQFIHQSMAKELILMHGFQTYPTPFDENNLDKLIFFKDLFGDKIKYGFMDHADAEKLETYTLPLQTVPLGISYLEKHITLDRSLRGVDYFSSLEPKEMKDFTKHLRKSEKNFISQPFFSPAEEEYRSKAKKVFVWKKKIKKGSIIKKSDVIMKRLEGNKPNISYKEIIGKKITKDVAKDTQVTKADLELKSLAVVVVRTNSSRLPNKALLKINDEETIIHLLKRLEVSIKRKIIDKVVFCTTDSSTDDNLATLLSKNGAKVYRGSEENVLKRMMLAIDDNEGYEIILRITGDDILVDPSSLKKTINTFNINNSDYCDAKGLPSGTEAEIFSKKILKFINSNYEDTSGSEYLTNFVLNLKEHFNTSSLDVDTNFPSLRLTLDTEPDFKVIDKLLISMNKIGRTYNYDINDIYDFFKNNKKLISVNSKTIQRSIPKKYELKVDWKGYLNDPLVTVYITCYNYERYVEKAISSVLDQNFRDFELIIIDDGSKDNSVNIINKYSNHPKVKILLQKNLGLNKTNNVALSHARGKYIIRLDADDFFDKNALNYLADVLETNDSYALVFPDYYLIDEKDNVIAQEKRNDFKNEVKVLDLPAHGACTMIRTSVLREINGYDERYDRQDGYEIWTKIANKYDVTNLNIPLFYYRQHPKSLTKNQEKILSTRSKILSNHPNVSKEKTLVIIPIRKDSSNNPLYLKKFGKLTIINNLISKIEESSKIYKIIVSSDDKRIEKVLKKSDKVIFHNRKPDLAALNIPIEETIDDVLNNFAPSNKDIKFISVINYEYPFFKLNYLESSLDVMEVFGTNSSFSVLNSNSNFYIHEGNGLSPLSNNKKLRLERDFMFEEIGGIHSVNFSWYKKNRHLTSPGSGHVLIDSLSSFKIKDGNDFLMANLFFRENKTNS